MKEVEGGHHTDWRFGAERQPTPVCFKSETWQNTVFISFSPDICLFVCCFFLVNILRALQDLT